MFIAETDRLLLREMKVEDAENAYLLNLDPDVIKYTGDEPFNSIEEARAFLKNYNHFKIYGFGRWAVIDKSTKMYLGWCGLKYTPEKDEHDIGFRFFKKYWNMGYATESAKASLHLGFNQFKLKTIVGRAMKENLASIKVLQKIGLSFYKNGECAGEEGEIYKIELHEYVNRNK